MKEPSLRYMKMVVPVAGSEALFRDKRQPGYHQLCRKSSQKSEHMLRLGHGPPRHCAVALHPVEAGGNSECGSLQRSCAEQILSRTEKSPTGLPVLERTDEKF